MSTISVDQLPTRIRSKIRMDLCNTPGLSPFCWTWKSARESRGGYGAIFHNGTVRGSHRVVYELLIGPVKPKLDIDHLCRNKACCNPQHLEPVTRQVNVQRYLAAAIADFVESLASTELESAS